MAGTIAYDNATSSTTNASSLTFAHNNIAGNLLVVGVGEPVGDIITGVTYNAVAMTRAIVSAGTFDTRRVYFYYLKNPVTGSNNVVISASGSDALSGTAISYTNADLTTVPEATSNTGSASTTSLTSSITTLKTNSWAIICQRGESALTAGAGVTQRGNVNQCLTGDSNGALTPAGAHTMTITLSAAATESVMMSIQSTVKIISFSDTLAMGSLDTVNTFAKWLLAISDTLAMGSLDIIKVFLGWINTVKSAIGSWINLNKS